MQTRTAELSSSNLLLEREVAEHAVARRQAEEANRAKNEFLGTLSHELREAVDDMLSLQWITARAKGLALVRDIADDLPQRIVGDRRKLNQILLNTIGNAVKFTDEGEVTVTVRRLPSREPARLHLRFEVSDTGTGQGLAVCRRLVALLGGRIGLDSVVGQGSTVHFELPFEPAAPVDASVDAAAATAMATAGVQRALDVLVVEDDEVNRTVCLRHLEFLGHRPHLGAARRRQDRVALLPEIALQPRAGHGVIANNQQAWRAVRVHGDRFTPWGNSSTGMRF